MSKNLPGIPQWELWDFLRPLINLATSMGEVLIFSKVAIFSSCSRIGGSSFASTTFDLETKNY